MHGHALVLSDVAIACANILNGREVNEPWCTSMDMEEALSDLLVHSEKRVQGIEPAMEEQCSFSCPNLGNYVSKGLYGRNWVGYGVMFESIERKEGQ